MQKVLNTASGLRPGSSIVKDNVSFGARLASGQLYQHKRESLKERVGNLIINSGLEVAENLVKAVPFANRFEVAYQLRRTSC